MTATLEATTVAGDVHERYAAATRHLADLEREQATIGGAIRQAALDGKSPLELVVRQQVLPVLIDAARRNLAPLAVEHYAAELAACASASAALHARWAKADAEVKVAEQKRGAIQSEMAGQEEIRRDLFLEHRKAMRHAAALAASQTGEDRARRAPVVRSLPHAAD